MTATQLIKQGESLIFCFDRNGEDIEGFTCTIFVKMFPDGDVFITRVIEPNEDDDNWPGFLTAAETAALAISSKTPYYLIGEITDDDADIESQTPIRFHVGGSWT